MMINTVLVLIILVGTEMMLISNIATNCLQVDKFKRGTKMKTWILGVLIALMGGSAQAATYVNIGIGGTSLEDVGGVTAQIGLKQQAGNTYAEGFLEVSQYRDSSEWGDERVTFKNAGVNVGLTTQDFSVNPFIFAGAGVSQYTWEMDGYDDSTWGWTWQGGGGINIKSPREDSKHLMRIQYKCSEWRYQEEGDQHMDFQHAITIGFDFNL